MFLSFEMQHAHLVTMAALLAICGTTLGQATTNTAPLDKPAGDVETGPKRERDAFGRVVGAARAGWWNDAVFYEVFVRSFKDSSGGALGKDGIGDIPGLIEKLDYLNDGDAKTNSDLGITGIWLMPINPSPSYHGYDVTDYKDVNPEYGTLDDFRKLTAACHRRGIRVILDLVMNHCSDRHPWFGGSADAASPTHDWFIWSDTDPGWKGPWGQKVWHRVGERRKSGAQGETMRGLAPPQPGPLFYGIFSANMPDLNFRNAGASAAMLDVVDFWVGKDKGMNADGYRLDAVRHLVEDGKVQENTARTHAWLRDMRARLKKTNPEAMTIGEVWTESSMASTYVGEELDMAFEFDLAGAMVDAARSGVAAKVIQAQERVLACYPPNQYGRFLTNHDQTRVMTELKGDAGAMRAAAAMLLLGPGVPFIYYGEEIGMTGDKPDENLRTPMQWCASGANAGAGFTEGKPWEAAHPDAASVNVEKETGDEGSLLSWYRKLIRLRGEHSALSAGGYLPVESGHAGVYAFVRTGERPLMVVVNLTGAAVSEYALRVPEGAGRGGEGKWVAREVLHGGRERTNPSGGKPIGELGAHQAYVLEIEAIKKGEE